MFRTGFEKIFEAAGSVGICETKTKKAGAKPSKIENFPSQRKDSVILSIYKNAKLRKILNGCHPQKNNGPQAERKKL
jgi:hypothetical protein